MSVRALITALLALAFASCAPTRAPAPPKTPVTESTEADRRDRALEITVYNNNVGLVKERRKFALPKGEGILRFAGVPSKIYPMTVYVDPLESGDDFTVIEQNFDYDLMSHEKLLDKYVGRRIRIMDWNEYTESAEIVDAELLSINTDNGSRRDEWPPYPASGGEVFRIGGDIYLGHPGVKILPEIPGNLISRPTLSWLYDSKAAREYELEVSYITSGMGWSANYVFVLTSGGEVARFSGWVTIDNKSGASYDDAKLTLVAGNINKVTPPPSYDEIGRSRRNTYSFDFENAEVIGYLDNPTPVYIIDMDDPAAEPRDYMMIEDDEDAPSFDRGGLLDYYQYDLRRPATVKDNQEKQISFMDAPAVGVKRELLTPPTDVDGSENARNKLRVDERFVFENSEENELGFPLPAGEVRIFADGGGGQIYLDADKIEHSPAGEEMAVTVKHASGITITREKEAGPAGETDAPKSIKWTIAIRNERSEDVTVGIRETSQRKWRSISATLGEITESGGGFRIDAPVGRGEEVKFEYEIYFE